MPTLVTLIGEQPIPSLLPIRHLQPERVLLVHTTGNSGTEAVARRVAALLPPGKAGYVSVDPYVLGKIRAVLAEKLAGERELLFNLTGGTKPMNFAAYALAAERAAPFLYFQTEGRRGRDQRSLLYRYEWQAGQPTPAGQEELPPDLLTLDDYLRAHLVGYQAKDPHLERPEPTDGWKFERAVYEALVDWADEVLAGVRPEGVKDQVEMDLLVRCGNQVAVLELKSYGGGKEAIDQLTTAAAREYLGTYTTRLAVIGGQVDDRFKALARALRIGVVEFPTYRAGQRTLRPEEVTRLRQALAERLPCRKTI
ncbi:MAG: hypothetical protein GYA30_08295 [Chloroflexi bacterium]|nr:hypothetical protein [Chloroflexota bacterium]HQE99864.1 hypothetical protein [Anaerolineae bacterium]